MDNSLDDLPAKEDCNLFLECLNKFGIKNKDDIYIISPISDDSRISGTTWSKLKNQVYKDNYEK